MNLQGTKRTVQGTLLASCLVAAALGLGASGAAASGGIGPREPTPPTPDPPASAPDSGRSGILKLAQREVRRGVRERSGNNVPRYRLGKGPIAPYSIRGNFWCAAFATWIWGKAGFDAFRYPTKLRSGKRVNLLQKSGTLWRSHDRQLVAVQVRALRTWAKATGRLTYKARPGDLVAYGDNHIGIVTRVDQNRRAIRSIEGNYRNSVGNRTIPMTSVIDYFSPVPLPLKKRVLSARSEAADVEFDADSPDRPVIPAVTPAE